MLDLGAEVFQSLPVTASLCESLSVILKGDPPWWPKVQKAWEKRKFVTPLQPCSLFLSCVHFEVLGDDSNPLVPFFPSVGGKLEGDLSGAFVEFLKHLPRSFLENLETQQARIYHDMLSPLWIRPAVLFFQRRNLPFYLVEVNAGAGLNLAADIIIPQKDFDSDPVAARIGLDPDPLHLENVIHRRWLNAVFMPDQIELLAALDRAIKKARERRSRDKTFIQLFKCPPELAAEFLLQNIPADDKDVGLLLFNVAATGRMTDSEYEAYKAGITAMMRPWEDRVLWAEIETVRGELFPTSYQLRVHRLVDDQSSQYVMASAEFALRKVFLDMEKSAKFLA